MENDDQKSTRLNRILIPIFIISILLIIMAVVSYAYVFHGPLSTSQDEWGQFGDYLGGILNPAFSFLALLGLLFTISLQSAELQSSTRELRNSAKALEKQNSSIANQMFESAFFNLLGFYSDILKGIDIRAETADATGTTTGRDCFKVFFDHLQVFYNYTKGDDQKQKAIAAYKAFHSKHQTDTGHYFRHLYHIIKFVDESHVVDKKYYTNLIRAQLSSYESLLLFYNCQSDMGSKKFKPLIEKYALLKNMPKELVITQEHLLFYADSAYT